jgi:hypothetical protein
MAAMLTLVACACTSSDGDDQDDAGPFDVSGYDDGCAAVEDCSLIYSGDPCGCDCDQIAIASSERTRYFSDRDAYLQRACPQGPPACEPCGLSPELICSDGQCGVAP